MTKHDKLAQRLAMMITKLNDAQSFTEDELAQEFDVSNRTIKRDLQERLSFLPLIYKNGRYSLDAYYLGKLQYKDIKNFAMLSGIKELYPALDDDFIKDILDGVYHKAYLVKGHNYEDVSGKKEEFKLLEKAIIDKKYVGFIYSNKNRTAAPYKLLNNKGIWYLAAVQDGTLKTFSFKKIHQLQVLEENFTKDNEIEKRLKDEDNIWFSDSKVEVVLKVDKEVANYFSRRKIIPNQNIVKKLSDGGLIVSTAVGHEKQIVPIIKYWIPYLHIVSPESLLEDIKEELQGYLVKM